MCAALKYNIEMCKTADKVLANGESIAAVAAELDVSRQTIYEWMDLHPEFKEAISKGMSKAQRHWEEIGKKGVTGEYEKFGGAPWIFTMKNRFRDDYKDKEEVKIDNSSIVEKLIDKLTD